MNAKDEDGGTPLHRAASEAHAQAVEALLNAGADVNAKDKDERTPHDWAESQGKGRTQAAETLRKAGADVNTNPWTRADGRSFIGRRTRETWKPSKRC